MKKGRWRCDKATKRLKGSGDGATHGELYRLCELLSERRLETLTDDNVFHKHRLP